MKLYAHIAQQLLFLQNRAALPRRIISTAEAAMERLTNYLPSGKDFPTTPEPALSPTHSAHAAYLINGNFQPFTEAGNPLPQVSFTLQVFAVESLISPWEIEFLECDVHTGSPIATQILETYIEALAKEIPTL